MPIKTSQLTTGRQILIMPIKLMFA